MDPSDDGLLLECRGVVCVSALACSFLGEVVVSSSSAVSSVPFVSRLSSRSFKSLTDFASGLPGRNAYL